MKILIYGAGAVGLGLASCLIKSGQEVHILGREKTVLKLKKDGLKRSGIFGGFSAQPKTLNAYTSLEKIPKFPFDFILVSVKSFDSIRAAEDIKNQPSLFYGQTKIVLFQNGLGNAEAFANFFDKNRIYNARVITGFTRPQPNEVTITVHADSIHIGSLFNESLAPIEPLCVAIAQGGLPCTPAKEIEKDLWAKMLYNCALNPLGAIYEVPYGVLGEHKRFRDVMEAIVQEIFVVMKAEGIQTHWPDVKSYLEIFYKNMLPATSEHISSTLQDIKSKKKTEIDALSGMIVKLAEKNHIPVPVNRNIYGQVKAIEGKECAED